MRKDDEHMRRHFLYMIICIILVLCIVGCDSGCIKKQFSRGRGDWRINLINGYRIDHLNASGIKISKEMTNGRGTEIVVENYYVTAYAIHEKYIFLKGIPTEGIWVTDQEKQANCSAFYAIRFEKDDLYGPFDTELQMLKDLSVDWNIIWTTCQESEKTW